MTAKFSRMLAICLLSSSAFGADLPSPSVSSSVGVNVTFTSTTASIQAFQNDMPMMAAAGIKFARMDFSWDLIEKTANTYDWSAYDSIVNSMIQYGIRPYFNMHPSNLLYESCAVTTSSGCSKIYSPQNPNSIAAFSRWAVAAVNHFNDPHNFPTNPRIIWVIWNEQNSTSFWFARPDATSSPVDQYLNLAKATCTAIRSAAPSTSIDGPALS